MHDRLIFVTFSSKVQLTVCPKCQLTICSKECKFLKDHVCICNLLQKLKLSATPAHETLPLKRLCCVTPLKSLLLDEEDQEVVRNLKSHKGSQHGKEIDLLINQMGMEIGKQEKEYLVFVCSVLDANAFEVIIGDDQNQTSLRGKCKLIFNPNMSVICFYHSSLR